MNNFPELAWALIKEGADVNHEGDRDSSATFRAKNYDVIQSLNQVRRAHSRAQIALNAIERRCVW